MALSCLLPQSPFMTLSLGAPKRSVCDYHFERYEKTHNIPRNLLRAIALTESGRRLEGGSKVPWPWTINANGTPYVFETKSEAVKKVKELQQQGITSIDVGCMQINLKYHPDAFSSLEEAFDPEQNIAYGAKFLSQMKVSQGNWHQAIGHYHSANEAVNRTYKALVMKHWESIQDVSPTHALFQLNNPPATRVHPSPIAHTHFTNFYGKRLPLRVRFASLPPSSRSIKKGRPVLRSFSSASAALYRRQTGGKFLLARHRSPVNIQKNLTRPETRPLKEGSLPSPSSSKKPETPAKRFSPKPYFFFNVPVKAK